MRNSWVATESDVRRAIADALVREDASSSRAELVQLFTDIIRGAASAPPIRRWKTSSRRSTSSQSHSTSLRSRSRQATATRAHASRAVARSVGGDRLALGVDTPYPVNCYDSSPFPNPQHGDPPTIETFDCTNDRACCLGDDEHPATLQPFFVEPDMK